MNKNNFCRLCLVSPTRRNRLALTTCYGLPNTPDQIGYEMQNICGTCRQTYHANGRNGIVCDLRILRANMKKVN